MKIIDSNKQPVSKSDYLTKQVGEIKQTAASFAENILKRHRHRLAAPKLLSLVYLVFARLNPLKSAANRPGSIYQKNSRIFKQRIHRIRQIIGLASPGGGHSNPGSRLSAQASIEPKSLWTGLQLSTEYPAARIIALLNRQFEIRRTSQPPGYLSRFFAGSVHILNAAGDAPKDSDPDAPRQPGRGFVQRQMQNHIFTEPAARLFLKGLPAINNLASKWPPLITVSKSASQKAGMLMPNPVRGLLSPRPVFKAPVAPVRQASSSARTGRVTTGSESRAEQPQGRIAGSALNHRLAQKEKLYPAAKNRVSTGIRAERLVMKRRPGILESKISPAVNPAPGEVNPVHPGGSQNLFSQPLITATGQPLITATGHRLVKRIVQKQQRLTRNTQFHEHLQSMTNIAVSRFQFDDLNNSWSPGVRLVSNDSYHLPVFPMSSQFNRNPEIGPIPSKPLNQNSGKKENEQPAPAALHPVKALEPPGFFRQPSLRYRRRGVENNQLPGRATPGGPAAMPFITESGSGASGSRQLPSEMDQRTGQPASEPSYLSQGQKEAVREYLNRMPRQEVNLVADKVYDLIEKRLSIEQERRGWA